jgi:hypothetical protein
MVFYVSNRGTISMHLYFNPYGMINIATYMIMWREPTCIDSYLKIYVHFVAIGFLGKRLCQRVIIVVRTIIYDNIYTYIYTGYFDPLPGMLEISPPLKGKPSMADFWIHEIFEIQPARILLQGPFRINGCPQI